MLHPGKPRTACNIASVINDFDANDNIKGQEQRNESILSRMGPRELAGKVVGATLGECLTNVSEVCVAFIHLARVEKCECAACEWWALIRASPRVLQVHGLIIP